MNLELRKKDMNRYNIDLLISMGINAKEQKENRTMTEGGG